MRDPYFSIIIPTHNRSQLLERALQSCTEQDFADFEIVVVDDGSGDDTPKTAAKYSSKTITFIRHEAPLGKLAAIASARDLCRGRFVAFLDDDDCWLPNHLSQFRDALRGQPDTMRLLYTPVIIKLSQNSRRVRPRNPKSSNRLFIDYILKDDGLIQNSGICISMELFRAMEFVPSVRKHVDYEICQLAERMGASFQMLPVATAVWDRSLPGSRLSASGIEGSELWLKRWSELMPAVFNEATAKAFLAFHYAPVIAQKRPLKALKLMVDALRSGYFSPQLTARVLRRALLGTRT